MDVLYSTLLELILLSYGPVCFLLIMILEALLFHRHVRMSMIVALFLLPPLRLAVNTDKGYIGGPLDKLNVLSSSST